MRMLNRPIVTWQKVYERLNTDAARATDEMAAQLAVRAARLSAYISRRQSGGNHASAVKRQNQVAAKVRLALGYAYKATPIEF